MAGQTTVGAPAVALAGMVASTRPSIVRKFPLKTADIDAGLYVTIASDGAVERPDAAGEVTGVAAFGGFTILETARDPQEGAQWQIYDLVPVLVQGEMYVSAEDSCTAGNQVYIRYASGSGGTTLGAVRDGAVSSETAALPRAYFAESRSGAGLVKIRVEAVS